MIFFRVTNNINIKITDGNIVEYKRLQNPSVALNETIYCTTYEDFEEIQKVLSSLSVKIEAKVLEEKRFESSAHFPKLLGVSFQKEHEFIELNKKLFKNQSFLKQHLKGFGNEYILNQNIRTFEHVINKNGAIYIAIIGSGSQNIGEMVALSTALRILYQELKSVGFYDIKLDIYVNASGNAYYKRDKQFFQSFSYIHAIKPLSVSTKQLQSYDYYIDLSSVEKSIVYDEIPYVDFYLRQFGINYTKIEASRKHNEIILKNYTPSVGLQKKIQEAKKRNKLLLFHPYSASTKRSIPIEHSKKILQKIIEKTNEYMIVTALNVEGVSNKNLLNLSKESKTLFDYIYIISQMDAMITADTSSYHIADAFFIPTVVLFTQKSLVSKRLAYYTFCKPIVVESKSKNYSQFIFKNSALEITNYRSWETLKIKKVMKLLDKIG
jgi:hypothetical protein